MSAGTAPLSRIDLAGGNLPEADPLGRLASALQRYDRRRRLQQTTLWMPRALAAALIVGVALAVGARLRPLLPNSQIALVALGAVVAAAALCLILIWARGASSIVLARRFDLDFDLQERVSTALALSAGQIRTLDWLAERQIADAGESAITASERLAEHLPLPFRLRDWLAAVLLLILLLALLILPNPQADALARSGALDAALADAAQTLEQIAEDVAADPTLDAEARQTLLEELRRQITSLENPDITAEEAFAALSETSSALQARSDELGQGSAQSQAALEQMARSLRQADGSGQPGEGDPAGAMQQVTESLQQIAERAEAMTAAERQEAAQALSDAAAALQQGAQNAQQTSEMSQQEAAEALRNAAEALRRGDLPMTQQQLSEAQRQLQQNAGQMEQQQRSRQELSEAAQEAREAAAEVGQAQQQDAQSPAEQMAGQEGERGMPQEGEGSAQQEGGGESLGEGSQQSPDGQLSQSGSLSEAQVQGQQSGEGEQNDAASVQAGDAPGTAGSDLAPNAPGAQSAVSQDNNPDGAGQREFEAVNVPQRIGGQFGGDAMILEADASDSPVQEGEFAENPEGQVTVPYDQVFGSYRSAADRALDSGYVPLALRDVVRDYFTSLEPAGQP